MTRKTMGRFINGCDAEQLDRLLSAPEFNDGTMWWSEPELPPCGCLVGTAFGGIIPRRIRIESERTWQMWREMPELPKWATAPASWRYPMAVARFGQDKVVRAIRKRAARLLQTTVRDIDQVVGYDHYWDAVREAQQNGYRIPTNARRTV